mmetsp:Transcript_37335/g.78214  ORF Transcript_37335/g.78214 Transcript_37335/m.78214 type:complete len:405 (-) Transcript_37335:624-1838(-)
MEYPNSGQRHAALRVKQKKKNDQQQWSLSGKLTRRPPSRTKQRRISIRKAWNDRFIFDEESLVGHGNEGYLPIKANGGRKQQARGSGGAQQIVEGKENKGNEFLVNDTIPAEKTRGCRSKTRHYTERADGEVVMEFTRCEISPSSPIVAGGEYPDLIGTRSTGASPFDMAKVRAALDANAIDDCGCDKEERNNPEIQRASLHEANQSNGNKEIRPSTSDDRQQLPQCPIPLPLDRIRAKSMLDKFEDLLYTIELEEAMLTASLKKKDAGELIAENQKHTPPLTDKGKGGHMGIINYEGRHNAHFGSLRGQQNNFTNFNQRIEAKQSESRRYISKERLAAIAEYAEKSKSIRDQQDKHLTKYGYLQYHEIVETLAESIADSCIEDIAEEIKSCINDIAHQVFLSL